MKLELKHLAPYLEHGLLCCDTSQDNLLFDLRKWLFRNIQHVEPHYRNHLDQILNDNSLKIVLRPLSDLPKNEFISELGRFSESYKFNIDQVSYWFIEKLFKKHFDVYGLIDAGLAIDINTLNK